MKTQVIQLNEFDDAISIKDKINWSKAPRILIVWPDVGKILFNLVDLELILRQADLMGAQLAFVSDDLRLLEICKTRGIQVFESIPAAYKKPWRRPKRIRYKNFSEDGERRKTLLQFATIKKKREIRTVGRFFRVAIFVIGIAAVLVLIAFFIPSAELDLHVLPQEQKIEIPIWSNPNVSTISVTGAIPARVANITVEGSVDGASSGYVRIPARNAVGVLQFRNLTSSEIKIPAGTIARTEVEPIVRFVTERDLTIPGLLNEVGEVAAVSLAGGVVGNAPPQTITAIEGIIGGSVAVENFAAFSGGTDIKTLAPTKDDYLTARTVLLEKLKQKAFEKFQVSDPEVFLWFEDSLTLQEIDLENHFPEAGMAGERFSLQMEATFSIWSIRQADLQELIQKTSGTFLAGMGTADYQSVHFETNKKPAFDQDHNLRWLLSALVSVTPSINQSEISQTLAGKEISVAQLWLQRKAPFIEVDDIRVFPSFMQHLPFFPLRIKMVLDG